MSRLSWTISRPSSGVMFYFEEADSSNVLTGEACGLSRAAGEAVFGKSLRSPLLFPHTRAPAHAQKKQNSIDLGGEITRSYDGRFSAEEPLRQTQMVELFSAEVSRRRRRRWRRSTAAAFTPLPGRRNAGWMTLPACLADSRLPCLSSFLSYCLKTPLKETAEEACLPCRPR